MYHVSVEQHFDAAHFLRGYQGKCEALHGHRFQVVVKISSPRLDDIGMAYDFKVLKQQLGDIVAKFDHTCLNDVPPFDKINPSSENIAATVYNKLNPKLVGTRVSLCCVEVWESPQNRVAYSPD